MTQPRRPVYLFDKLVIGYSGFMVLLLLAIGRPLSEYIDELSVYAVLGAVAFLIARTVDEHRSRWHAFVRLTYPAIMFGIFYRLTGGTILLVFDSVFDAQLAAMEKSILGFHPTLFIQDHLLNVVATEVFSFCYFCYYLMIPGFVLTVFFRKHDQLLKRFLAASSLTFFAGYIMFFLYPVEGPRWYFADVYSQVVDGPVFRPMVEFVIANGAVRGGAMPSTHTAVALIVLYYTRFQSRLAGAVLAPVVLGLAIGTVWGRFHYISDTIVGALMAMAAIWLIEKYSTEPPDRLSVQEKSMMESTSHAT